MVFLLTWDVEPPGVLRGRVRESSGPCGFPQFVCEVRTHMVVGTGDPARPQLGPWRGLRDEWVMASREFRMADWGLGSGGCAHQVVQGSDWAASKGLWRDSGAGGKWKVRAGTGTVLPQGHVGIVTKEVENQSGKTHPSRELLTA